MRSTLASPQPILLSRRSSLASIRSTLTTAAPPLHLTLPNKGCTARDHLGIERTLLAWVRLSITLLAVALFILIDVRIAKSPPVTDDIGGDRTGVRHAVETALGSALAAAAILALALSLHRYLAIQHRLATTRQWLWRYKHPATSSTQVVDEDGVVWSRLASRSSTLDAISIVDVDISVSDRARQVRVALMTPMRWMFIGLIALALVVIVTAIAMDYTE